MCIGTELHRATQGPEMSVPRSTSVRKMSPFRPVGTEHSTGQLQHELHQLHVSEPHSDYQAAFLWSDAGQHLFVWITSKRTKTASTVVLCVAQVELFCGIIKDELY